MCDVFVSNSSQYAIQRSHDHGMYIKPGAFVTQPEHELAIDARSGRWLARWRRGVLFWYHVDPAGSSEELPPQRLSRFQRVLIKVLGLFGRSRPTETLKRPADEPNAPDDAEYIVRGPDANSRLALCILDEGDRLVVSPSHLIGYSSNTSLGRRHRWDLLSFLMRRHQYWYIDGPGEVLLCGMGGIAGADVTERRAIGSREVVAWINSLHIGLTSKQGLWAQVAGFNEIGQWTFEGDGLLVSQASVDVPPRAMPNNEPPFGLADLLTVVSGFGM